MIVANKYLLCCSLIYKNKDFICLTQVGNLIQCNHKLRCAKLAVVRGVSLRPNTAFVSGVPEAGDSAEKEIK